MQKTKDVNEQFSSRGMVTIRIFDSNNKLIYEQCNPNLIVTSGKQYLAAWLAAASQAGEFMSYIALGTGTTPPTTGDTGLETPLPTRVLGTLSSSSNVWQNVAVFGPGVDTGTITEAGLFTTSSGGTMYARQVFSPVTKSAGDTLSVTWQVTFS